MYGLLLPTTLCPLKKILYTIIDAISWHIISLSNSNFQPYNKRHFIKDKQMHVAIEKVKRNCRSSFRQMLGKYFTAAVWFGTRAKKEHIKT